MKERYVYLDVLKGIAILCVCSYHFSWVNRICYQETMNLYDAIARLLFGINCICVPMFFMVNGALVLKKEYSTSAWLKNMAVIVLQCLAWRFISIMIISMVNGLNPLEHGGKYLADAVFFGEFEGVNLSHMWFIYALVIVYLLMPFIKALFDRMEQKDNYLPAFLALMCVLCFATKSWITIVKIIPVFGGIELENIRNFLPFDGMYGPMLCYFILGGIIHKMKEKAKNISNAILVLCFAVSAVFLYVKWYVESKAQGYTYDNVFFGYDCIAGLVMTVSLFLLIMKQEERMRTLGSHTKGTIAFIGRNTMNVYYIHWILGFTLLPVIYEKVGAYDGILLNLLKSVSLVVICSILGELGSHIPGIRCLFRRKFRRKCKKSD